MAVKDRDNNASGIFFFGATSIFVQRSSSEFVNFACVISAITISREFSCLDKRGELRSVTVTLRCAKAPGESTLFGGSTKPTKRGYSTHFNGKK